MPITRIPVVHKFGIISQSQRVDLEKRITKKALTEARARELAGSPKQRPLPFEVTQEFVFKFNDSSEDDREKLQDVAFKMLQRLKRLAGLKEAGDTDHSNISRAWVDLALLAQCTCSVLEEACLDALLASLDQAPFVDEHVLSLFYVAKTGLHCLRREMFQPEGVLRSGEIKLLKMTSLVFLRLYCHHIIGHLKGYEDQQGFLARYFKGFSEKAECYSSFPGCDRAVQLILESAKFVCGLTEGNHENEDFAIPTTSKLNEDLAQNNQTFQKPDVKFDIKKDSITDYFVKSGAHDAQPSSFTFLWHSLNVWYSVNYDKTRLKHALYDLLQSIADLDQESWLLIVVSFHILTDASCQSIEVLEAFQYLISLTTASKSAEPVCHSCYSSYSSRRDNQSFQSPQIHIDSSNLISPENNGGNYSPNVLERLQAFADIGLSDDKDDSTRDSTSTEHEILRQSVNASNDESLTLTQPYKIPSELIFDNEQRVGSTVHFKNEDVHEEERIVRQIENTCDEQAYQMTSETLNYHWPWVLLYTFCECMSLICRNGSSSKIQKLALLGKEENENYNMTKCFGLIDFLYYGTDTENGHQIRYGAAEGLLQIYRHHRHGDSTKQGLSNAAWFALMECNQKEKDHRVLDAMKIGKVEADLQNKLNNEDIPISLLSSRISTALSEISHTRNITIPTRVSTRSSKPRSSYSNKRYLAKPEKTQHDAFPKPSLRQEINLHTAKDPKSRPNQDIRRNLELRDVIDEQWRKELHESLLEEMNSNIEELEKLRRDDIEASREATQVK